jgi:hypothetical protein
VENWNGFSKQVLVQSIAADTTRVNTDQDRIHMIVNNPDEKSVIDLWFILYTDATC